jgi:L-ascorbate metabolism protein UlaG (beta-lactamase superfamily)
MNRVLVLALVLSMAVLASAQRRLQEDTFTTSAGDLKITCLGHGTLMLAFGGKVFHVDPVSSYVDAATAPKADVILITHEHGDHLDAKAIQAISTDKTIVIVNPGSSRALPAASVMKNGDAQTVAGVRVQAVPAYNLEKPFHPKGNGNGYVLTFADKRVYIAGDTENIPEMKALKQIDIAFLPMNLPFTMTPEQVADAAKAFRPKVLYPYHFGNSDTAALVALLKDEKDIEVRIRDLR